MNHKAFSNVALVIVLVVLAAAAIGYIVYDKQTAPAAQQPQSGINIQLQASSTGSSY